MTAGLGVALADLRDPLDERVVASAGELVSWRETADTFQVVVGGPRGRTFMRAERADELIAYA